MRRSRSFVAALALAGLATFPPSLAAQDAGDREAVERAAMDYLEGLYEGDVAMLERSVHPSLTKIGYYRASPGRDYSESPMSYEELLGFARRVKASGDHPDASAPKRVEVLDVRDQTAAVKVTAWWGTDYMQLAKIDGRWMILHVLWQS